ncbi:IclR family transcriptional regulator [Gordoniibacillus kamchatkensis]|uniref:IclR family transcriptional regulator n=1 Tax=Gordoniibacillus kamchatkensis TaxID=1590651 RepID=A0ABR5ANI8_9BACL|nr:IclR family transcriptional regulator [Paenibacillus sp. VKM B-2647]KIL42443.1 IclR family transcriptional regulator [Paenibacillus sp. VKM B-2647]
MLKTLDQSLAVLNKFTREHPSWGVRELASEMEMSHSIVYRILATYHKHGFLEQDKETRKYGLGLRFIEFGAMAGDRLGLAERIRPIMKRLSEATGESVFLTWLDGREGVCLDIYESSQLLKYALAVGSRTPLYAGASNKIIMAYLTQGEQERIIAEGLKAGKPPKSFPGKDKLLAGLQNIRQEGWAYSLGDYSDSVFGIAVPLFNRNSEVTASLTVAGPEYRMPQENVAHTLQLLRSARDEVQQVLQHLLFFA